MRVCYKNTDGIALVRKAKEFLTHTGTHWSKTNLYDKHIQYTTYTNTNTYKMIQIYDKTIQYNRTYWLLTGKALLGAPGDQEGPPDLGATLRLPELPPGGA